MFKAPQEIRDQLEKEPEGFLVWPENRRAVELFIRLTTQWNISGMGSFTGIKYESLNFVFNLFYGRASKKVLQELFQDIQVMEFAALRVLNEEKKK